MRSGLAAWLGHARPSDQPPAVPGRGFTRAQLSRILPPAALWQHRYLIGQLTRREVDQRYRGTYLGFLWSALTPLLMLAIYTFVFSIVLRARWGNDAASTSPYEFALTLFAGLIPFNVFSEVINTAPTLVLRVPNYVKKVVFPLEVLPLVTLGSAIVHALLSTAILLVGVVLLEKQLAPTVLLLPLAFVPLVFLCLGLGWLLASLGVYVRDIGQSIAIVTQILFFLSPIFYPVSAMPPKVQAILMLNPLTNILENFRRVLLWNQDLDWLSWLLWTLLTSILAVLGFVWFIKTKPGFADVL